jgi:hypothetical protein
MGDIWTPDLIEIGINPEELPTGWGWTTLSTNEDWTPNVPLTRRPQFGEFMVVPYVTDRHACNRPFERAQLVVASIAGEVRRNDRLFLPDATWYESLIPWGAAPQWWLFGPQGKEFFTFARACQRDQTVWDQLGSYGSSVATLAAVEQLRHGPSHQQKLEVDQIMADSHRLGAVARALSRAGEVFYGPRISRYNQYRYQHNQNLAPCYGSSLYGVASYWHEQVGAMDNAIRWLILRDVLPAELYRHLAEPWLVRMGWPLHPNDGF